MGDSLASEVLAAQACGPKFRPQAWQHLSVIPELRKHMRGHPWSPVVTRGDPGACVADPSEFHANVRPYLKELD